MFCQHCGGELRFEDAFCAVCGTPAPRPTLHQEPEQRGRQGRRRDAEPLNGAVSSNGHASGAGFSLSGSNPPGSASHADPRQIRTFQAIRHASGQRGSMRALPPVASLAVPSSLAAPEPAAPPSAAASAQAQSVWIAPPEQAVSLPMAGAQALSAVLNSQPLVVAGETGAVTPVSPANGHQPMMPMAPVALTPQSNGQPALNGFHPIGWAPPGAPASNSSAPAASGWGYVNGSAPAAPMMPGWGYAPQAAASVAPGYQAAANGFRLPGDLPNRFALAALVSMLLSFFLPWVIISGIRATALTIGWPMVIPMALIGITALTVLLPERALYARFFLALPLVVGCFALGSALIVFLVSSAIAANTVGGAFLGVDIGFVIFTLAALLLACAGYYKLIRELPLLLFGRLRLVPLPGMLGGLAATSGPRPPTPRTPPQFPAPYATYSPVQPMPPQAPASNRTGQRPSSNQAP